jgi:hypothetical protein
MSEFQIEGEWKGWRTGQCPLSDDPKTPDYVEPEALSLQYVQFTPQEAEHIFLNIADMNKKMLALNTDTNSGKAGIICYPYQNSVINKKILDAPCEELFPFDSEVAESKCEALKAGIAELANQEPVKSFWEKAGEKALELLWEFPVGIAVGAGFAVGGGLVAKRYGWLDKIKEILKNGKNGGPGGAGGASAGGGAGFASGARAKDAANAATAALLSAALLAAQSAAAKDALRTLEMIKNSPSIRVHDAPVGSNGAVCLAMSFALGAAAYWAAGAVADASIGVLEVLAAGAGIGAGAVEAGTLTTAIGAAGYFY